MLKILIFQGANLVVFEFVHSLNLVDFVYSLCLNNSIKGEFAHFYEENGKDPLLSDTY